MTTTTGISSRTLYSHWLQDCFNLYRVIAVLYPVKTWQQRMNDRFRNNHYRLRGARTFVHVAREPVDDATSRREIKERHRSSHDRREQAVVQPTRRPHQHLSHHIRRTPVKNFRTVVKVVMWSRGGGGGSPDILLHGGTNRSRGLSPLAPPGPLTSTTGFETFKTFVFLRNPFTRASAFSSYSPQYNW